MGKIEVQSVTDDIAESIKKLSIAGEALKKSGLNQSAQIVLLQEAIGSRAITRVQIAAVLNMLPRLGRIYLENKK